MSAAKHALIIVESPTKAKTVKKFLGKDCTVIACMGHVRDLPERASDIPEAVKKEKWSRLGVNVKNDFQPLYVVSPKKTKVIKELKEALKSAQILYLATDEDREGESISWHLLEILKPRIPTKRMVFHEITKEAIKEAFDHPRDLDMQLVKAQEARRILDRLVGYTISPLLWKKIAFGLSAGRVQSVALKTIVDLEQERIRFVKAHYWGINTELQKQKEAFAAKLIAIGEKKLAIGKDFDERTGKLNPDKAKELILLDEQTAKSILGQVKNATWKVTNVEEKPISRKPAPPFITSTLQQEANRKLGLSSRETMRIAQTLYERGFITYMRTDSVNLSEAAIRASRNCVNKLYGEKYLSPEARRYTGKSKGAQEAHEAIRPSLDFTVPHDTGLSARELKLYEMIWMRTIATQMAESKQLQIAADLEIPCKEGKANFRTTGMKILFPGFLKAYVEGSDDPEKSLAEKENLLPDLKVGDTVQFVSGETTQHETKPPARYTEASLIQFMEKEGIGRPSTYASVVSTIIDRGYVKKQSNALVPTFVGFAVTQLMSKHFHELVDVKFTSLMEEKLDDIAEGKLDYLPYLKDFFLGKSGLEEKIKKEEKAIDPDEARSLKFDQLKNLDLRVGKYGAYFEYIDPKSKALIKANIPEDLAPSDLNQEKVLSLVEEAKIGPKSLGKDPQTQLPIFLKTGSYGPYLQLGDVPDKKGKLKRVSIKGFDPATIDEARAIQILTLPRKLGTHPETNKEIIANVGRFGPYIAHDGDFRSLKNDDNVLTVTLSRALEIFKEPKGKRGGSKTPIRTIGEHPVDKIPIAIYKGPYGAYIKYNKINVTIPKEKNIETLTLQEAVELIAHKATNKKKKR